MGFGDAGDDLLHLGGIERRVFPYGREQPLGTLTVGGGVASKSYLHRTAGQLLQAADEALYAAKQDGRNQVNVAKPPQHNGILT